MASTGLRLSRRKFLGVSALGVGGLASFFYGGEAVRLPGGAIEASRAWNAAALDNDTFLTEKGPAFDKVVLGCSFTHEQWSFEERATQVPLQALDFCVRELGLREVRLDIRWDRVASASSALDIATYRPYLDYCFDAGLNVCLNLGPIRTFRWPEDRVPDFVLAAIGGAPKKGQTVEAGSPLAMAASSYLDALIDLLLQEYGDKVRGLSYVQPENESFQGFDERSWRVSLEYMEDVVRQLDGRLPGVPILVTTAGRPALDEITDLFRKLLRDEVRFRGRLISGFDYYYSTPRHNKLPLDKYLDPIALAFDFPSAKTCDDNLAHSRSVGFQIEVSEAQAEPYAHVTEPGNSAQHFRFMLLRLADKVLDPRERSVLRIWGVEELDKKALSKQTTDDHAQIFDLIRRLTSR